MISITIYEDRIYAGHGTIDAYGNVICDAILGEDQATAEAAYEAIEHAIKNGGSVVSSGAHDYSWETCLSDDGQIEIDGLRTEAAAHGDEAMVDICERALEGDTAAMIKCYRVINDARAQRTKASGGPRPR